ncbi:MAG: hypothetical protein OSJ54_02670 [Oscillospiraceae bacterium]|nr:hypothetical protein [Oscillospiraceae bacterium]
MKSIKTLLKPRKIAVLQVKNFVNVETVEKYGVKKIKAFSADFLKINWKCLFVILMLKQRFSKIYRTVQMA